MKIFVFDTLWESLLTEENKTALAEAGVKVILTAKEGPLSEMKALYEGDEPRILAVNPDYVGWSLPAETYKNIPNLKAIITASTSYGWIAADEATKQGTAIINIRNFSTEAVADWAVMVMLNLARRVPLLIKDGFPLNFGSDFQTYQGINLKGKKAGIIGLGNIGNAIAQRCHGLGMDVNYWSQSPKRNEFKSCSLPELFRQSDVIFPAMSDNETTKTIITDDMLVSMGHDTLFVSVVHKYYNHELLLKRVEDKALFGYGFEDEKPCNFLNYNGNVWASPAYAWCTSGSLRGAMDLFVSAIIDASHERFPNRVN